jgi:hypothetical protein
VAVVVGSKGLNINNTNTFATTVVINMFATIRDCPTWKGLRYGLVLAKAESVHGFRFFGTWVGRVASQIKGSIDGIVEAPPVVPEQKGEALRSNRLPQQLPRSGACTGL